VRAAFAVVGLAAIVYGAASLTGGWLGTPPWWESTGTWLDADALLAPHRPVRPVSEYVYAYAQPREGREWISGGVVAVGAALVAVSLVRRRAPSAVA